MNRIVWHIPLAVILSISAHLALITLLNGGIRLSNPAEVVSQPEAAPSPPKKSPKKPGSSKVPKMETYPIFQDNAEPEEIFAVPDNILDPDSDEPLARPLPMIRVEAE